MFGFFGINRVLALEDETKLDLKAAIDDVPLRGP